MTTASEYIRRVGHVCGAFNLSPNELAKMSEKNLPPFLLKVVSHFEAATSTCSLLFRNFSGKIITF